MGKDTEGIESWNKSCGPGKSKKFSSQRKERNNESVLCQLDSPLPEIRPQDNLVRSVSAGSGFTLAARIFAVAAAVNDGGEGQSKSKNGGEDLHGCNLSRVVRLVSKAVK